MPDHHSILFGNRRQFLRRSVAGAGVLAVLSGGAFSVRRWLRRRARIHEGTERNPFAYDVTNWRKTDPGLIHYRETGRTRRFNEEPRCIACGLNQKLLVAAGNYVHVLDTSGEPDMDIALSSPPRCLTVAIDETIYIGLRDHIEAFDRQGQRRASWASPAPGTWFTGLAAGENDLFAADARHRVVLRYDRSGKLVGRIGEKNPDRGVPGFVIPSPYFDVELHRDGLLRVANPGRHRIEAYTLDGDFEFAWGKASAAIEAFCGCCNPIHFALLPDGRTVTCEKGLPRVKVYGGDGSFECVVAGPEDFSENSNRTSGETDADESRAGLDVAVDSRGRIFILDPAAGNIRMMERKPDSARSYDAKI